VTLSPLPPVGCELTDPLARLLFQLHQAGLFGPKPGPLSSAVPEHYRCCGCHSRDTRMKLVGLVTARRGPITGFECRARCCGAINRFKISTTENREAA